jgi:hypothetical protein
MFRSIFAEFSVALILGDLHTCSRTLLRVGGQVSELLTVRSLGVSDAHSGGP